MKFNQNEEAVSPVIGVILMVAITVILAAVIAVFVFGMADDIQTTHSVAATAKVTGDDVIVTFQGGPDADVVSNLSYTLYNGSPKNAFQENPTVGFTYTFDNGNTASTAERILITATFDDGTTQVILDKQL